VVASRALVSLRQNSARSGNFPGHSQVGLAAHPAPSAGCCFLSAPEGRLGGLHLGTQVALINPLSACGKNPAYRATRLLLFDWTSDANGALLSLLRAPWRPVTNPAGSWPWRGRGGATDDVAHLRGFNGKISSEIPISLQITEDS